MKRITALCMCILLSISLWGCGVKTDENPVVLDTALPKNDGKMRLIITQDGEVDDRNSLIHTLLYANDIDIEGIVQTSSVLHYSGDENVKSKRWMGTDWMYELLDAYESVYPNLIVHDSDYPTPEMLRAITAVGNIRYESDMATVTEGSELIKEVFLKDDPRPLFVVIGGGSNTVARALMSIQEEYEHTEDWEDLHNHISENVILIAFGEQDRCYQEYILPNWQKIRMIDITGAALAYGYRWATVSGLSDESRQKMSSNWMIDHLEKNRGALMDKYVTWGDGTFLFGEDMQEQYGINEDLLGNKKLWVGYAYERYDFLSEGDSPAWFVAIPNGLRSNEDLSYGGWYGRYSQRAIEGYPEARYYQAVQGREQGIAQWIAAIQSDSAMRASWCVSDSYEAANHLPVISVKEGNNLVASAGTKVTLHVEVVDPDGNETTIIWYQYPLGDTYDEQLDDEDNNIPILLNASGKNGENVSFVIPADAESGDTIHIIVECIDEGGTNPRAYQRIIIRIK